MDDHLIGRMREILAARDSERRVMAGANILFAQPGLDPIALVPENISAIPVSLPRSRSAFVDGGLGDVFVSPSMCVHLVRIHSSIWSGTTRMRMHTQEAFVIVLPRRSGDSVVYEASFYSRDGFLLPTTPLTSPSVDRGHQVPISSVANKVRAVLEARECERLCEELDAGDVIVRDGLLHSSDGTEQAALDRALELAWTRRVCLAGLAKTANLYTDFGDDALRCADRLAEGMGVAWIMHPIALQASELIPDPGIVKLHAKSRHVFRLDVLANEKRSVRDIASLLAVQSCDAAFLGYPYPLVLADRLARVPLRETQGLRCRLLAACKVQGAVLETDLASLDAHGILDALG